LFGYGAWNVDDSGRVVILCHPEQQIFYYGKTLEEALAWSPASLMATGPKLIVCQDSAGGKDLCCRKVGKKAWAPCIDPPPLRQCAISGSYHRR
jgi:acetone carboxylase gamma subunit